ncbi:MAG: lysostaphin resistance A-like protein [Spirochaetales bacterium]
MQVYNKRLYSKDDSASIFLYAILLPQIFGILLGFLASFIATMSGVEYSVVINYVIFDYLSLCLAQIAFLMIFFGYNAIKKIDWKMATKINVPIKFKQILVLILIALATLFLFSPLINLVDYLIGLTGYSTTGELPFDLTTVDGLLVGLFAFAFLPAVFEELLFRGIVFNGLKKLGIKKAIIFSALIFALMHLSIEQTVYQIIIGVLLAYAVYVTGSLWSSIVLHFVNNFVIIMITFYYEASGIGTNTTLSFSGWFSYIEPFLYALGGVVVVFLLFKLLKFVSKKSSTLSKEFDEKMQLPTMEISGEEELTEDQLELEKELNVAKEKSTNKKIIYALVIGLFLWIANFVAYL